MFPLLVPGLMPVSALSESVGYLLEPVARRTFSFDEGGCLRNQAGDVEDRHAAETFTFGACGWGGSSCAWPFANLPFAVAGSA